MGAASASEFDRAVRHTYKLLLTRGMLGSVVYSTDPKTKRGLARPAAAREVKPTAPPGRSAMPGIAPVARTAAPSW